MGLEYDVDQTICTADRPLEQPMKIACIGFGKMAEAIWRGAQPIGDHMAVEPDPVRASVAGSFGLSCVDYDVALATADWVLLCIKPQGFIDLPVFYGPNTPTIISIMAGVSIAQLKKTFPGCGLVRAMPNTPSLVGRGMTALSFYQITDDQQAAIVALFKKIGDVFDIPESWMNTVTGISGSGPAFLYKLCQSAIDAGAEAGMPPAVAVRLLAQTMVGAGTMLQQSGKTFQELIADVTSPGGTTLAGLTTFDAHQINDKFTDVIRSAIHRSQELSS